MNTKAALNHPAYDPAILLKIILFAYSKGITSSREIQWCCETNIIFKALSCDTVPHFTTIAGFVSSRSTEIESLFEQVLLVCDEQGLLGHQLFAIDGCKMSSYAAKDKYGKRHQKPASQKKPTTIPATEFYFDPVEMICLCPNHESLTLRSVREDPHGNLKAHFEGRLLQCRHCPIKAQCMKNPCSADYRNGSGRQVSFILNKIKGSQYTD